MIFIMREYRGSQRAADKVAAHERIVQAAACAIRRSGYDGPSVAEIMQAAGLTHGAFYAHFPAREALLVAAADRAGAESVAQSARVAATAPSPQEGLAALIKAYLSPEHVQGIETGCVVAALGSEMPRQGPEVRQVATRRIKEMLDLVARQLPDWDQPEAHAKALVTMSTMVGALVLARAVDDPALSDQVREAALAQLIANCDDSVFFAESSEQSEWQ